MPMLNATTSPTPLSQPPTQMPTNIASPPSVLPLYPSVDIDAHVRFSASFTKKSINNLEHDPVNVILAIYPVKKFSLFFGPQTESNHDTALTLACAGGHEELVSVLIARGANIEHRDKKGTQVYLDTHKRPLIIL